MSGATFCVNDVEQASSHHASVDAATLLAQKAAPPPPCPPAWEASSAFAEYMALPHEERDEVDMFGVHRGKEIAGYTVRRLRDAPGWLLVKPPPDEADRVFKPEAKLTACKPYFCKY